MENNILSHDGAIAVDKAHLMQTYGRYPLVPQSASGATVTDCDGKKYIDFTAGIGVNSLGWCDSEWIAAVESQLHSIQHISNYYYSPVTSALAGEICEKTDMERVFFGNSGAEANEGAIKVARKYSSDRYGDGRATVLSLRASFHGRTLATLAATGQDVFHGLFTPMPQGFAYAELNDIDGLEKALTPDVCAVIAEPIQGEGGVNMMTAGFAARLRELCDERDIVLIFDEVQTGVGRCGELFAHTLLGVKPDVLTMAKGLGGGLPIGAFAVNSRCADVLTPGLHGSTFGGNPVVCAGAREVIRRVSAPAFLADVRRKGDYIRTRVNGINSPAVLNVRGAGLMIGISVEAGKQKEYAHEMFDRGLLVLTAGADTVRLLPPLTVSDAEMEAGCDILCSVLK